MTYPLPTLAPTIDANGISAPNYSDIYQSLIESFKQIFGSDIYIEPDSQDGQMIAIFAQAIHDSNQTAIQIFQSFSPTFSQGKGLSSIVKLNGIQRNVSSHSIATVTIVGVYGSIITNGVATDSNGFLWDLPTSFTIPISGTIDMLATCREPGAIEAAAGDINGIYNPQLGWQSVSNAAAASLGSPVEKDSELKQRQKISTSLPSLTVLEGMIGSVWNLTGVAQVKGYENDSDTVDANGLPSHSTSLVVDGGDQDEIANAIALHKTPGSPTYGTTAVLVYDEYGMPNYINFFRPTIASISVEITITALTGYVTSTGTLMKQAAVDFINGLKIGDDVLLTKIYVPINLPGNSLTDTFDITLVRLKKNAGSFSASNVSIGFNELANSSISDITLIVA